MHGHRTVESVAWSRWMPLLVVLALPGGSSAPASPTAPNFEASPPPPAVTGIAVAGGVSDAAFRPLVGATVQVSDGAGAGPSTTTDSRGEYRLFGNFDKTTQFRATKDGHTTVTRPLPDECAQCNPHWWIYFSLESVAPHSDLSGDYTLTFLADDRCVGLPDELRVRTFDARITRSSGVETSANSRFDVTVRGASMVAGFDRFVIGVAGDYLAASIGDSGHDGAGLVERLGASTYVTVAGESSVTVTNTSTITASMDGVINRCELTGEWTAAYNCGGNGSTRTAHCQSQNHQLVMRRR